MTHTDNDTEIAHPPEVKTQGMTPLGGTTRDPDAVCWCCAGATIKRHCKIVCTNCGFMRDCSDP